MTNYEMLKNMSIEEMAVTIMCPKEYDHDFKKDCDQNNKLENNCCKCTLEWLKSEI